MPKLYKKDSFKDNCGFGLIANLQGRPSRKIVIDSIEALKSMTHRGGIGSDGKTGDGCGSVSYTHLTLPTKRSV